MRPLLVRFVGRGVLAALAAASSCVVGCASLLGIDEATCDPMVDPACDPNAAADDAAEPEDAGPMLSEGERVCDEYCSTLSTACTEEAGVKQYETEEACFRICVNGLDTGTPGDTDVDTAHCRLTQAENAALFGEDAEDCASAGLGANGACSDECEVYCTLVESLCTGVETVEGVAIVDDYDTCLSECAGIPHTDEPFNFTISSGNSLECRFWHLQAAFGNARTHCVHAVGIATCVP